MAWESKSCLPKTKRGFLKPSIYTDVDGTEWMIFLGSCSESGTQSYLYDIKNNLFIPFVSDYNEQFKLRLTHKDRMHKFDCYVIDQKNHMLYIYDYQQQTNTDPLSSLLKIDIRKLKNPQLLENISLNHDDHGGTIFPMFGNKYEMLLTGNKIHFISSTKVLQHYIFDIKTNKLNLINDNVLNIKSHQYYVDTIDEEQEDIKNRDYNFWYNLLKIGTMIEIRRKQTILQGAVTLMDAEYHQATIIDTKHNNNNNNNNSDKNILTKLNNLSICCAMDRGSFTEWIDINAEILCNCVGHCNEYQNKHRIAVSNSQTQLEEMKKAINSRNQRYGIHTLGVICCNGINDVENIDDSVESIKNINTGKDGDYNSNCNYNHDYLEKIFLIGNIFLQPQENLYIPYIDTYIRHAHAEQVKMLVHGYINQYNNNKKKNFKGMKVPLVLYDMIDKYYNFEFLQWTPTKFMYKGDDYFRVATLATFGQIQVLLDNKAYLLVFSVQPQKKLYNGKKSFNVYKCDIDDYSMTQIASMGCPSNEDYKNLNVIYCETTKQIHLFDLSGPSQYASLGDVKLGSHFAINLSSILADNTDSEEHTSS